MTELALIAVILIAVLRELLLKAVDRFESFKLHLPGLLLEINEHDTNQSAAG
jgi:hypothetical protein